MENNSGMATKITRRYFQNQGIGMLRISFGLLLTIAHGWPTVKGFLAGADQYPDPLGLGSRLSMGLVGFAELICAMLLTLGIFNRLALIPIIFSFAVAFFIYHHGDPLGSKELALHYLLIFVVLFITGPGDFTIRNLFSTNQDQVS